MCFMRVVDIIFYVVMKQPKSLSILRANSIRKPLFPSFRQSRQITRLQQLSVQKKSQLLLHVKLLPVQLHLANKNKSQQKVLLSCEEVVFFQQSKTYRQQIKIADYEWISIAFMSTCDIKMKKIGDQNIFTKGLIFWDRQNFKGKVTDVLSISLDKVEEEEKKVENSPDQNEKMKRYVANMMAKKSKHKNQSSQKAQIKYTGKRTLQKNKLTGYTQTMDATSLLRHDAGTANSTSTQLRSLRQNLKQSKFIKSQKQTSVGGGNSVLHCKKISLMNEEQYLKKKLKFDSQPYFHQNHTLSQLDNTRISHQKETILQDKSIHKSEEESIEEQIGRSRFKDIDSFDHPIDKKQQCQSLYSSKQLTSRNIESSGTLYESRYQ